MLMKMTSRMDWMMMMVSFSVFLFWNCLMLLVPGSSSTGRAQVTSVPGCRGDDELSKARVCHQGGM